MYLKSLKLAGFKSFVDVTTIPVRSNMNAVVGPNGCGKSNIVDAVRWVIGETSAKQLRGKSMTDVIFNGTSTRKPVGKALVELTFDNQDGRAGGEYAKFNEVAIRRELQRDGQSNYFINGTLCRRRDIVDIFLGTGLGPRSYAIIEQGMISQLIEAKPDEFRVYLEEAAGISKYKERRRETESRIRRTQENLERINDLCEELAKQLRHLKRQANAAERYKHLKEEERLLQAQMKALQWQTLADQLHSFEERINAATLAHEEQLANQRHLETDIEKSRLAQAEANDRQNAVQKRYYALGAEIARVEQQIKDTQEQTQRWRNELEEAENLWQELTESSAEHQDQVQEISEELATLSPQKTTIQAIAQAAQEDLQKAETAMSAWQDSWERYQKDCADTAQRSEVSRTNITHFKQQLEHFEQRQQRLTQTIDDTQLELLEQEIVPIDTQANDVSVQLETIKEALNTLGEQIAAQRRQNTENNALLNDQRRALQTDEARYASLQALQEAALSSDDEVHAWLDKNNLLNADRLGKSLHVNAGWELAVETVLGGYFDAVCVDDAAMFVDHMDFESGSLTLVDSRSVPISNQQKGTSLADQVQSNFPIASWLASVYIAEDTSAALAMRDQLSPEESIITQEGLWIGPNWIRRAKPADSAAGVLAREQELKTLSHDVAEKQKAVEATQAVLEVGETRLNQLEQNRDEQHRKYQTLSQSLTEIKTDLSAKRSRYNELQQQQARFQEEMLHCSEQIEKSKTALEQATAQLEQSDQEQAKYAAMKEEMIVKREHCRDILREARELAQREQQKADELEIRLASNESQLALLRQTVSRAERQMQQLSERRNHLTTQLADTDSPLEKLNEELQKQLNTRISIEEELRAAEETLESYNQHMRQLESKRNQLQNQINEIKDRLQTIQMQRQELTVRQTTIQEQLAESNSNLDTVLETMPEEANIEEWEQRSEALAQKINRLGPINLAAIEEYDQISERKTYLDKQQADLHEALDILQNAIRKIDRETRQKFKETYDKVNEGFKALFPRIFGGGSAALELEEDDLLTSGVIVRAQPPGKRNSTIHMLSGGEKALTAISLVFALFQLNPAPFCVLDEVDAPLDDINVGRFCQMVHEMSKTTQFIVISHNKVTIEMADHLMGVTMQEAGVSRIVSVDMEEAIAMTEA